MGCEHHRSIGRVNGCEQAFRLSGKARECVGVEDMRAAREAALARLDGAQSAST